MIDFEKLHDTLLSYKEHSVYKKRIKFDSNVGSVIKEDGTFYSTESFLVWFKYKGYAFELDVIKTTYNNGQEISVVGDLISSPSEYLNELNLRTGDVFNSIVNSRLFDYASWEKIDNYESETELVKDIYDHIIEVTDNIIIPSVKFVLKYKDACVKLNKEVDDTGIDSKLLETIFDDVVY